MAELETLVQKIYYDKCVYAAKVAKLQAENRALRSKVCIYKTALVSKFDIDLSTQVVSEYPPHLQQDAHLLDFKRDVHNYTRTQDPTHIIPILEYLIYPNTQCNTVTRDQIREFNLYF
jgi:hypothetical protein